MGYETKLIIGRVSSLTSDEIQVGDLTLEDGEYKKTGRKETWFQVVATIDLCKCGYESPIHNLDRVNTDKSHYLCWYEGNDKTSEDCYGDKLKPVTILDALAAIKAANKGDEYRRFEWAIGLLESMKEDESLSVLLYGH